MTTDTAADIGQPVTAAEYCRQLVADGLIYAAEFVPQSLSRNAGAKRPTINWRVTLSRKGRKPLTCDYSQGIAHRPGYNHGRKTMDDAADDYLAAEGGKTPIKNSRHHARPLPKPELADILYSLVSDSDVLEYPLFEDWAPDFGYDPDSREAEKIYRECLKNALALRQLIDIDAAREAFADY